jgi:mannose-6-phosphate isomerase-like protein (cupin superfamily)
MPFIAAGDAKVFTLPGVTFAGLAAPSRGATDNAAWIVSVAPGTPGTPHRLSREEILIGLEGSGSARIGDEQFTLTPGSAAIVPAGAIFALANEGAAPFRAVVVLPVGAQATIGDGPAFTPPWAV